MNLYNSIFQRKSCRDYDMQPLDAALIQQIEAAITGFEPLYSDGRLSYRFCSKVAGRFTVKAPHYLVICGDGSPGELENAGFVYQQLCLWLDAMGLGCVWLGSSRDSERGRDENDLIVLAFGKTLGSNHRSAAEFKRMELSEICSMPDDSLMKAVQLAPSGMNCQPWYFDKQGDIINVYRRKLKGPVGALYKLTELDMGIGLCHYALACKEQGRSFSFEKTEDMPERAGHVAFGIIR